uniref:Uncharacterized protein n=1 Tax=Oryza meridionalis TaxID=40149 RepID=A0A0E0C6X6_9ORYZ
MSSSPPCVVLTPSLLCVVLAPLCRRAPPPRGLAMRRTTTLAALPISSAALPISSAALLTGTAARIAASAPIPITRAEKGRGGAPSSCCIPRCNDNYENTVFKLKFQSSFIKLFQASALVIEEAQLAVHVSCSKLLLLIR